MPEGRMLISVADEVYTHRQDYAQLRFTPLARNHRDTAARRAFDFDMGAGAGKCAHPREASTGNDTQEQFSGEALAGSGATICHRN
jgi:hypothetical protein